MIDGKSFNTEELKKNPLDEEIKKLVYLINKVDGVETIESCFGHHKNPCRIFLRIKNIDTANKFIKKFFYFDRLWSLKLTFVETDDYFDELLFKLESAYQGCPTVDLMVENLTERFEKRIYNTAGMTIEALEQESVIDKIRAEMEQLPVKTRINWDGCCPDFEQPEIEFVDVPKAQLLEIIDKYKVERVDKE